MTSGILKSEKSRYVYFPKFLDNPWNVKILENKPLRTETNYEICTWKMGDFIHACNENSVLRWPDLF